MEILENRAQWLAEFRAGWRHVYEATGEPNWKIYNRPKNSLAPAGPAVDLAHSRLLFITSSGAYWPPTQAPFDAPNVLGDYGVRVIPTHTPLDALAFAHDHYDHTAVNADAQVLVPLRHLEALVTEGYLGELAPNVISFSGYQPQVDRVLDETIPAILEIALAEKAHAVLLVPA